MIKVKDSELKCPIPMWIDRTKLVLGVPMALSVEGNQVVADLAGNKNPIGYLLKLRKNFVTIGYSRKILKTKLYDSARRYTVGGNIYVRNSLYTTIRERTDVPAVGVVVYPPTSIESDLTFLWF